MSEFKAIGLIEEQEILVNGNKIKEIILDSKFSWFLSDEFEKLRDDFTPTDNRECIKDNKKEDQGCKEKLPPGNTNFPEKVKAEGEDCKEKLPLTTTTTNFSIIEGDNKKEQIFWRIYDELEQQQAVEQQSSNSGLKTEVDRSTVSGQELKNRLVSSNEFFAGDAFQILEDMTKKGKLEKVAFDTYKRKEKNGGGNNNSQ